MEKTFSEISLEVTIEALRAHQSGDGAALKARLALARVELASVPEGQGLLVLDESALLRAMRTEAEHRVRNA